MLCHHRSEKDCKGDRRSENEGNQAKRLYVVDSYADDNHLKSVLALPPWSINGGCELVKMKIYQLEKLL